MSDGLTVYTVLNALLTEINTRLLDTTAGQPDRVCVYPGLVAFDNCECGLLAGGVTRTFPSETFPQPLTVISACQAAYNVTELTVYLLRCAPGPQGRDLAPTCEALDAAAQILSVDTDVARRGIICRLEDFKDDNTIIDFMYSGQQIVGPEGGCVGVITTALIGTEA